MIAITSRKITGSSAAKSLRRKPPNPRNSFAVVIFPLLYRCRRAEHDRRLARQHTAVAMREGDVAAAHVACSALAPDLANRLDEGEYPVHPGMAIRESTTVRVDRQLAARRDAPTLDEASALALGAETQVL